MLGLINSKNLHVDVETYVEDPLVNLHEATGSTARIKSIDHELENDQSVVEPKPTRIVKRIKKSFYTHLICQPDMKKAVRSRMNLILFFFVHLVIWCQFIHEIVIFVILHKFFQNICRHICK